MRCFSCASECLTACGSDLARPARALALPYFSSVVTTLAAGKQAGGEQGAISYYLSRIARTEASGNSFDSSAAPASMDALVKQCEAAGEAVKQAKAAGDAADIKAKVAALVKTSA